MRAISSVSDIVASKPEQPIFTFRPKALKRAVASFAQGFRAAPLYAVKTNPEAHVIDALAEAGVQAYDVASLEEVKLIAERVPNAVQYFMHPVKSRHAIRQSYFAFGVRHFSFDSEHELQKIIEETEDANDLCLHLRIAIPNSYAELNLAEKFGIGMQEAPSLLKAARSHAAKLGVCFHVGSQCMHPDAYRIAMRMVGGVIRDADVVLEYFNVGGGFPSIYPGMNPPEMQEYFDAIHHEFDCINEGRDMQLLCEPGRALVAEAASVIVRVDLRKDTMLYINDGTYGSLFDAGTPRFIFPVKLVRTTKGQGDTDHILPFSFYGPTCDSLDFMKGPFYLPQDIREGDYIEIGQIGAYGRTMATAFNGFSHAHDYIVVDDYPLMTMYGDEPRREEYQVMVA